MCGSGTLADRLFAETLELALSGDFSASEKTLDQFRSLPRRSTGNRARLCQALLKTFGNVEERRKANRELIALDGEMNDLITKSLLVSSYIGVGREWDYFESVGELHDYKPKSFEEFLFRGYAYAWGLSGRAGEDLQTAVRMRPSSGIARVLLADALQRESENTIDRTRAMELAELAVKEVELAVKILPSAKDSMLALIKQMDAYLGIFELSTLHHREVSQSQVDAWAERIVSLLNESLRYSYDWEIHRAQLDALWILEEA